MIRSGKNPRHKDSSANNDETKQDIISNLPDSLLIDILSLLPESHVKQTRLVSKRWKNLFAFLQKLCFLMKSCPSVEQVENFHVFVDQTLAIRGCMPIEKLLLKCENKCDYDCLYDLLCTLVRFKAGIQELELRFPVISEDRNKVVKFCSDLFKTWNSLVGLTLVRGFVLDVPDNKVIFPCLKKLKLSSINYLSCESVANLFSGCPVLEELYVLRELSFDRLEVFNISSLSLKRLRISSNLPSSRDYKVVIDAPKLEYIYIQDFSTTHYSLTEPLSFVEADIHHSSEVISQLVPLLSSAKILNLTPHSTGILDHVRGLNMPMFPNLVRLVIGLGFNFLLVWLKNMPNLEYITLSYSKDKCCIAEQDLPEEPPVCLLFKMKEIVVRIDRYLTKEEFTLIKYLLKNSISLKNFRIYAFHIDRKRRKKLLNFHRGSECCQIEFI